MTPKEELLTEYLRIATSGLDDIYVLVNTEPKQEKADLVEVMYISQALFSLPCELSISKSSLNFRIELTEDRLKALVDRYPRYKYWQDAFITATQKYLAKQKPPKSRASSSSSKGAEQ